MPYRRCLHRGCTNLTRASYCHAHRRDTNLARARLALVYDRDLGICQLCGEIVGAPGTPGPHGPTLDHIVAVEAGGSDATSNLRLAHRSCNSKRG